MVRFGWVIVCVWAVWVNAVQAQTLHSSILIVDSDAVYERSEFAQMLRSEMDVERAALEAENTELAQALEQQERDLTEQRKTLSPEEFQQAAADFDARVQATRRIQGQKVRQSDQQLAAKRREFFGAISPIVELIMLERGASVILESNIVTYRDPSVDITAELIERVDQTLAPKQGPTEN